MLITLEGIDGGGKTTVAEALQDAHPEAVFTREPTDSWYGEAVARSIADPDADPLAELFLYTADHAAHLSNTVRPALDAGEVVIADRYSDSRYAYQGAALDGVVKRPMEYVRGVHQPWTHAPDATIYLDLDPEQGAARSGATNKFEQVEYLDRVRTNYEQLLAYEPDRFVRIDASQSPETVIGAAEAAIERLLDTAPE